MSKVWKFLALGTAILGFIIFSFGEKGFFNNKVIGMAEHPGLQGEILFQENIIYNFKKGNLFNYFNTDYLNYPIGENLGFAIANSFHLYLYIPLRFFLGTIESYNAMVIIIFLLNLLMAYFLAKYLFSSKSIAFCSALVFALNPYVLLKINMGFVQKYALFWIPLYCLALFKLRETKKWRYVFGASFILCLIGLFYPPYAYYTVIFTIVLSLYVLKKNDELKFILTRLSCLVILGVFFLSIIYYFMNFENIYFKMLQQKFNLHLDGCLDLFNPFHFYPYHSPGYPTNLPLGMSILTVFLAIIASIKKGGLPRLIFLVFIFFVIIAAGPYLLLKGQPVKILEHKVVLPFYFMSKYLPYAGGICFPIRVFPFINLCLSILTGYGLIYLLSKIKRIASVFIINIFLFMYLLENLTFFPQLFPPKISETHVPKFYQDVKKENCKAILNLPISFKSRRIINRYGYYAALSGKNMMNSYFSDKLAINCPSGFDSGVEKKKFIKKLSQLGVGYIVVHKDFLNDSPEYISDKNEFGWLLLLCEPKAYLEDNILVYKVQQ